MCKGLEEYKLDHLIITDIDGSFDYSLKETLTHIGLFLRELNGEVLDSNTLDLCFGTGKLMNIYSIENMYEDEDKEDLNRLNDEMIKNKITYEAADYLDLYINYLLKVSRQCQKTNQVITNAQEKFLERRYHPSGKLAKQASDRFYNPNKK
jgi:hypothetical protein